MASVELFVEGSSAANGVVLVNGAPTAIMPGSGVVMLRGTSQTSPGNGGNLRLAARQGAVVVARSEPFSVSSIPTHFTDVFHSLVNTSTRIGIKVQDGWSSDSGTFGDLDQTEISEQVQYTGGTGVFAGTTSGNNSGYLSGISLTQDTHSSAKSTLTGPGYLLAQQTSIFKDNRTGAADIPMNKSGYHVHRFVTRIPLLGWIRFRVHKLGTATIANGFSSTAGSGDIDKTQTL